MPKKSKSLCVDDLRHAEYYDMQTTFDTLYQKSMDGEKFEHLMELILSRDNILLAYRNIKLYSRNRQSEYHSNRENDTRYGSEESEVYCHRKSAWLQTQTCKAKRYPKAKWKNTSIRDSLYMGQAGTAMCETDFRTNM